MATSQASSRLADEVDPIETGESGPRTPGKPAKADPIKFGAHNVEEAFERSIVDCYPETTKIGWLEYDTVTAIKELDPISWDCARSDWESNEESEGQIFSTDGGSTYYWTHEVETYLDENESEEDCA